jgi:hypothetical protein
MASRDRAFAKVRERAYAVARFSDWRDRSPGDSSGLFTGIPSVMFGPDGTEREIVSSTFLIDIGGSGHFVSLFRDVTASRADKPVL